MTRTPDWLLERIALGELPPRELAEAKERLMSEPEGPERLRLLEADNQETLRRLSSALVAREVARRQGVGTERLKASTTRRTWLWAMPALLAAASVALVVLRSTTPATRLEADTTRIKGMLPTLQVYRRVPSLGRLEAIASHAQVAPGDVLQLRYKPSGAAYGLILSIDGRGGVTLHWPESRTSPSLALRAQETTLPYGYALDDAPGFERFIFVTSDTPFAMEGVWDAAERLARGPADQAMNAPLPIDGALKQHSVTVFKSQPHKEIP